MNSPLPRDQAAVFGIKCNDLDEVAKGALFDCYRTVHVGFSEPKLGIPEECPGKGSLMQPDRRLRAGSLSPKLANDPARINNPETAPLDHTTQRHSEGEKLVEHPEAEVTVQCDTHGRS